MRSTKWTSPAVKGWTLAAALGGAMFAGHAAQAQTVTAVMQSGLRVMDPITTTAFMSRDHGYMIYDTLLGMDEHFQVRPQMADWQVSDDALVYTFTLREGLQWHDGQPVTADDCIASIKRWASVDATGQVLMTMVAGIEALDDRRFEVRLEEPTTLLLEGLAKLSSRPAFMMPERIADTPASTQITEYIGSGPFKFVTAEFQPGAKAVYEKNPDYVPRDEPSSWTAGGKVVKVDRVEWLAMPDQMTAINALQSGDVDFIQQVPFDLLPLLEQQEGTEVEVLDQLGAWSYFRFNHLYPPFDDARLRQAAMYAVSQQDVLDSLVGNPDYYRTCAAVFGCGNPNENDYGAEMVIPANLDRARALLEEAHYDGTPVVLLQPTDLAMLAPQPVVIASALRAAGFNVDMRPMDWQSVVMQQSNQNPPAQGGWNLFSTFSILATSGDPFGNTTIAANGREAWAGWPDVPEIEALRLDYARSTDAAERKEITAEIQRLAIDQGVVAPLGQFQIPAAYSDRLSDVSHAPVTIFWGMGKSED